MVDFTLTEAQENLREMARDFAEREIRPVAHEYDRDAIWPQGIIDKGWEVGLVNSHLPGEYGGVGAAYFDGCLIAEELARGCAAIATTLGANELAATPELLGGSEEIKSHFLGMLSEEPKLASIRARRPLSGATQSPRDGHLAPYQPLPPGAMLSV